MPRMVHVWTWDSGERELDLDGPTHALVPVLETIVDGGLWKQFRKFPTDTLMRLLPHLRVDPSTRHLIELWIEEAAHRPQGAA